MITLTEPAVPPAIACGVAEPKHREAFEYSVRLWLSTGGPLVCQSALSMGPPLSVLSQHIHAYLKEKGTPRVETRSVAWLWDRGDPVQPLAPHSDPGWVRTVVFPVAEDHVSFGTLWLWRQRRAEMFWFIEDGAWRELDPVAALTRRLFRRLFWPLVRRMSPGMGLDPQRAEKKLISWATGRRHPFKIPEIAYESSSGAGWDCWADHIAADNEQVLPTDGWPAGRAIRVTHFIGALCAGGAERQLCNLALGLAEKKQQVQVWTAHDARSVRSHYNHLLARSKVAVRTAHGRQQMIVDLPDDRRQLLRALPADERERVFRLASELSADPPDLLHCWLDDPNLVGGMAALFAGVPRILLSFRNLNPTHFPRLLKPHMQAWYQLLSRSERVHFLANSHGGAASYASWLQIPEERIHVVLNGVCFDHFPEPSPANRAAARRALGLKPGQPVLLGVFRLDVEKQPELFLEAARHAQRKIAGLQVLIAGTGPLESDMRAYIARHGMHYVRLLGRREDIGQVYLAGDMLLLTSTLEGCPNVALEAQYFGLPVVATDGGGTRDALVPGHTGFLTEPEGTEQMASYVVRLFEDHKLRAEMGGRGPTFIKEQFHLRQMVDLTFQVYQRVFSGARRLPPIVTPPPARLRKSQAQRRLDS
jgi:glycosyltransferase involved in cell wall biosynthesis